MYRRFLLGTLVLSAASAAASHDLLSGGTVVNPARLQADRENAKLNFLSSQAKRHGADPQRVMAAQSVYQQGYVWGKFDLKVCFWNGTAEQQNEVMGIADIWHLAVPSITFNYMANGAVRMCQMEDLGSFTRMADIRITLADDARPLWNAQDIPSKKGDWSYPGKAVSQNPAFPTTMNLVGSMTLRANSRMSDYYFNVRHEFGHALSLVHEHQRGICKGWFNIPEIAKATGWTEEFASSQVDAIDESSNAYGLIGGYDLDSIMQYNFALAWYMPDQPGNPNPCRRKEEVYDLSEMDKYVVAALYQPALNQTPARIKFFAEAKQAASTQLAATAHAVQPGRVTAQAASVNAALETFSGSVRQAERITIQVYPHKTDEKIVMSAVSNLGYALKDAAGNQIRSVSAKTNPMLRDDPTNTILYTPDVSDQDVRYVAVSLLKAGIELKSIQPYVPHQRNNYAKRNNLIQIGADVTNRKRQSLTIDEILEKPLPIFGAAK